MLCMDAWRGLSQNWLESSQHLVPPHWPQKDEVHESERQDEGRHHGVCHDHDVIHQDGDADVATIAAIAHRSLQGLVPGCLSPWIKEKREKDNIVRLSSCCIKQKRATEYRACSSLH